MLEINREDMVKRFKPFEERMRRATLDTLVITTFRHYYYQLLGGGTGLIDRFQIDPIDGISDVEQLEDYSRAGQSALGRTVVVKLNGGLGTGMGMEKAKSLLEVKKGLSFLDIIAQQVLHVRSRYDCSMPLILMNSFYTRADSLAALENYPSLRSTLPLDFVQHKVPKVDQHSLAPVDWPHNPELEWCPPGHGDLYTALVTSGILEALLAQGFEYAFVSNADNLGAVMDIQILGYCASHNFPFLMEVADRTEADRKGGHIARMKSGNLTLRERAQCPEAEEEVFQDITVYKYFNTNTLWVNLTALKRLLEENSNMLSLPLIINSKTLDPRDTSSPRVFHLETAMGSALSVFTGAQVLRVPRLRFAPVKACSDILGLWSDAYILTEDSRIIQNPERTLGPLVIELDPRYYKLLDEMKARFVHGVPSLVDCEKLVVAGDVLFGRNVVVKGTAHISTKDERQHTVPDEALIEGTVVLG
jgi:UTP--glucose-1-phosphate uridylyltransferase